MLPSKSVRPWLHAGFAVFLTGTVTAAVLFFVDRPFDPKAAILSDLQSPDDNPRGYPVAAAAASLTALLLAPAVAGFHRRLRPSRPRAAGTAAFAVGLSAAFAIGVLAPVTHDYTPLHVALASTAFVGISAGCWLHLLAAGAARSLLGFQLAALAAVVFLSCGPVQFDNRHLLTSLALWEWILCLDCAAALWLLARKIESLV